MQDAMELAIKNVPEIEGKGEFGSEGYLADMAAGSLLEAKKLLAHRWPEHRRGEGAVAERVDEGALQVEAESLGAGRRMDGRAECCEDFHGIGGIATDGTHKERSDPVAGRPCCVVTDAELILGEK